MKRILITGATGNIGLEVLLNLSKLYSDSKIYAAVRDVNKASSNLKHLPNLHYRPFDFEDRRTHQAALDHMDVLFLLRPPHLSNIEKVFRPILQTAKQQGVGKVVFLSVQGAEKSTVIPHNKIERLIQELGFDYIFVRPAYFMQNLTTTLLPEIKQRQSVTLPSGKATFNWIDVKNIGEVTAHLINGFERYQNQAFDITGTENKDFGTVVDLMSGITGMTIRFKSINPISFYFLKKKEGMKSGFVLVMLMLHFLPRLQSEPKISDNYQKLTGKSPTTLKEFLEREKEHFMLND